MKLLSNCCPFLEGCRNHYQAYLGHLRWGIKWWTLLSERVYTSSKRLRRIYIAVFLAITLIGYTWYQVSLGIIAYGGVLAGLKTLSALKLLTLVFEYPKFCIF